MGEKTRKKTPSKLWAMFDSQSTKKVTIFMNMIITRRFFVIEVKST